MAHLTQEQVEQLVDNNTIPDTWNADIMMNYDDLKCIIDTLQNRGKILSRTLPILLKLLKPNHDVTRVPCIGIINRQIRNKESLSRTVAWLEPMCDHQALYIGPFCQELGINLSTIQENTPIMRPVPLTSGMMLELKNMMTSRNFTWNDLMKWLETIGINTETFTTSSLTRSLHSCQETRTKFSRRNQKKRLHEFLGTIFTFPNKKTCQKDGNNVDECHASTETCPRPQQNSAQTLGDVEMYKELYEDTLSSLKVLTKEMDSLLAQMSQEVNYSQHLKCKYDKVSQQCNDVRNKLHNARTQLSRWNPRNARKREKRKEVSIHHLKDNLKTATATKITLQEEVRSQQLGREKEMHLHKEHVQKMQQSHREVKKSLHYYKGKSQDLSLEVRKPQLDVAQLQIQCRQKDRKINALIQDLTAMMEDRFEVETINSGVYTQDVRETVMSLHSLGLGINSIADCIKIVCGKLLHVDIGVLPKTSTIKGFLLEANLLGRLQVANAMMTTEDNTLHFDGTSDHQRHFFGFQLTNQSKESMVMSMSESVRGDTKTQMDTFTNICSDYSKILAKSCEDEKSISARLIMSIKNLMSDQHIVNKKFCEQFEDLRGELITECGERWSGLSIEDRTTAVTVNHFFCLLHVLLGLADATDKALKEYERILTDGHRVKMGREKSGTGRKFKGDTSMAMECLRSLCQLLTPTGHAAAGLSEDFRVFLDSIDKFSLFTRFEHNRFNVIFENAAAACHHRSDVREFLKKTPSSNQLVQSVVGDMEDDFLFAEIQAAGLFYFTITEPFHRLILSDSQAPHILDVLPYLQTMQRTLEMMSKSPVIVVSPDFQMWTDFPSRTGIAKNLFLPSSDSQMDVMLEVLGLISSHTLVTYSRQFISQQSLLSSQTSRSQTASVPKSNSISESVFGTLKRLRQFKPNATTHHLEGTILWTYNKTISWLDSLSEQEKSNAFDVARNKSAVFHKLFKERHLQLKEERIQHLASKKHQQEQKAVRQSISREKTVDGVLAAGGHCTSTEAVDDLLATYDNNFCCRQLTQTLKTNLSYFKQVVKPPGIGRVYYQYSHKGKTFTNIELANHLKHIIATYKESVQTIQQPSAADSLTSKEDRQGPLSAARKRILSQYSIPGLPQKKKCRGPMPALLGSRITHRWKLSTKRGHAWYEGQVLCRTCIGTQPSYAEDDDHSNLAQYDLYDVQYDGDENIYHMRLEKDWHMGDLELLEM